MHLSDKGLEFIASFEGYHDRQKDGSCKPYRCQAGKLTIGYGCTEGITESMRWTKAEALERFRMELVQHETAVGNATAGLSITQNQADALISFSYNVGPRDMQTIAKTLRKQGAKDAAARMLEYNKFTNPETKRKEISRGLMRRRAAEARLMEPDDTPLGTMPQKVEAPPRKVTIKEAVAGAGGVGTAAVAVKEVIPPVPPGVKDAIANAKDLQSVGGEIAVIGKSAYSAAVAYPILAALICACVATYWWLRRASPQ